MKNVTVFLQNAWSPAYAGRTWPRESWLAALHRSRSGQRLRLLTDFTEGVNWWFDNTTPIVGDAPSSVVPPDYRHMQRVLVKSGPAIVVCMGGQAQRAWRHLHSVVISCSDLEITIDINGQKVPVCWVPYPVLFMPHPTYRVLSNDLIFEAADLLTDGFEGLRELKQLRRGGTT